MSLPLASPSRLFCLVFAAATVASCQTPKPTLVQGMVGFTSYDRILFEGGANPTTVDPDVTTTLGAALQQSFTPETTAWDAGIEGGLQAGFSVNSYAIAGGGGGGVIFINADTTFLNFFGGPWVGRRFQNGLRAFAGAGPLVLMAWANSSNPTQGFSDSSSQGGTYVRAGIEYDIGPAGTIGITVQRIDSILNFDTVGRGDVSGYTFSLSLTRAVL